MSLFQTVLWNNLPGTSFCPSLWTEVRFYTLLWVELSWAQTRWRLKHSTNIPSILREAKGRSHKQFVALLLSPFSPDILCFSFKQAFLKDNRVRRDHVLRDRDQVWFKFWDETETFTKWLLRRDRDEKFGPRNRERDENFLMNFSKLYFENTRLETRILYKPFF